MSKPMMVCNLYDILMKPISLYGCEVWGVDQGAQVQDYLADAPAPEEASGGSSRAKKKDSIDESEKLHKMMIKKALGVRSSTPGTVVLYEVGRFPLAFAQFKLILNTGIE